MDYFMQLGCPASFGAFTRFCVGSTSEELEVPGPSVPASCVVASVDRVTSYEKVDSLVEQQACIEVTDPLTQFPEVSIPCVKAEKCGGRAKVLQRAAPVRPDGKREARQAELPARPAAAKPAVLPAGLLMLPTPARCGGQAAGEAGGEVDERLVTVRNRTLSSTEGSSLGIAEGQEGTWPAQLLPAMDPVMEDERGRGEGYSPLKVSLLMRAHLAREGQHVYVWRDGKRSLVNLACITSEEEETLACLEEEERLIANGPDGAEDSAEEGTGAVAPMNAFCMDLGQEHGPLAPCGSTGRSRGAARSFVSKTI